MITSRAVRAGDSRDFSIISIHIYIYIYVWTMVGSTGITTYVFMRACLIIFKTVSFRRVFVFVFFFLDMRKKFELFQKKK